MAGPADRCSPKTLACTDSTARDATETKFSSKIDMGRTFILPSPLPEKTHSFFESVTMPTTPPTKSQSPAKFETKHSVDTAASSGPIPPYAPPVSVVMRVLGTGPHLPEGDRPVTVSASGLRLLMRWMIRHTIVDEQWYANANPDVAQAIAGGLVASCSAHFQETGYFEGRQPSAPTINEDWYLTQNPDVEEAVSTGVIGSAAEHFTKTGQHEGRASIPEHKKDSDYWLEAARARR